MSAQRPRSVAVPVTPAVAWHAVPTDEAVKLIGTDPAAGLDAARASALLVELGPNELEERGGRSALSILVEQFTATMVLILVAAGVVSLFLGKWYEAIAIFAIVVLFGLLGFVQEFRAERAMAALRRMAVPVVRVRRGGAVVEIAAKDLVPGDIVLLEAGNVVPADCRLVETASLRAQESALTGESEVVEKDASVVVAADAQVGDRTNMAHMGTVVAYGRGEAIVVATGMRTQLGHVATLLHEQPGSEQTPLQRRLDRVGKGLALAGVGIAGLVALFGVLHGESAAEMFLVAVSVAVAIVPEGLPAVVTITLALGARRMLARHALIRSLPAVETLGSVTVICSDKTGTLTQNRMTVTVVEVAGMRADLAPAAAVAEDALGVRFALAAGALVNDAQLGEAQAGAAPQAVGDPTESAIVVAAASIDMRKAELEVAAPRSGEVPFDSDRKRMTTVHEIVGPLPGLPAGVRCAAFTKGSVDGLLGVSSHEWEGGAAVALTPERRARIEAANLQLAGEGMRVLGVAWRPLDAAPAVVDGSIEAGLTFLGMLGMIDPARPEVKAAVAACGSAGIRVVMITGDHPLTARVIARELGISTDDAAPVTGADIDRMDDAALGASAATATVFARVSPAHKLRLVSLLRARGDVVAMTGDGVNDAPALRKADIGVAMGITGTDVTKEAAEVVLQDDNFATIVAAVEEGRVIFDNVRKFVKFSIAGNAGKVAVMLLAPPAALALTALHGPSACGELVVPLLPLQLLWLNLLTDGLLGVGLGMEPAERNVMRRSPVPAAAGIFVGGGLGEVLRMGAAIGAVALGVGLWQWSAGNPAWQTMMFATLAFAQVAQALGVRGGDESVVRSGVLRNRVLAGLAAIVVALQLAALYAPPMRTFLGTSRLASAELAVCVGAGGLVFVWAEIEKARTRRGRRAGAAVTVA
ncbi:MAG: cation-translocating P-type ATPase [Planctomycetes bacterium]|nr:cation-translocating P-type ATPase [Planctomycetota bacterium]